MEYLRCNKCYRLMKQATKKFMMTQCGHIFCEPCLSKSTTKCHECGAVEFTTLVLEEPPKLETMINYFSPVANFIQLSQKATQFHEEQQAICLRSFKQLSIKYKNLKVSYTNVTENMKSLSNEYKKIQAAREKLEREIAKVRCAHQREKMRHSHHNEETIKINVPLEPKTSRRLENLRASETESLENVEEKFVMHGAKLQAPTHDWKKNFPSTREYYRYNPSPALSKNSWTSTNSSIDSGTGTAITSPSPAFSNKAWTSSNYSIGGENETAMSTPPAHRHGDFVVPSIQKVPKSVATWQKSKQGLKRD